ncbi:MAG TPA: hypothetical protein VFZ48_01600 [Candidatus Saccharimonadales bacterium]
MRAVDPKDYWITSDKPMKVSATPQADDITYEAFGIAGRADLPTQVYVNGSFQPNIRVHIDGELATGVIRVKYPMFDVVACRVNLVNKWKR